MSVHSGSVRMVMRAVALCAAALVALQPLPASAQGRGGVDEELRQPLTSRLSQWKTDAEASVDQNSSDHPDAHSQRPGDAATGRTADKPETNAAPRTTEDAGATNTQSSDREAVSSAPRNGWVVEHGERYWYDHGVMARSKEVYDAGSRAWYWFDADGTMARDKDVYLPAGHKWVRYDHDGHMIKGEDVRYGAWYDFDQTTGAMKYGFVYHANGQKWVFYDRVTGRMLYGQQPIDGHWYLLNHVTGAVEYGWQRIGQGNAGKWVLYDWPSGHMRYGNVTDEVGHRYYLNPVTGAYDVRRSRSPLPSRRLNGVGVSSFGGRMRNGGIRSVRLLGDSIAAGVGASPKYEEDSTLLFTLRGKLRHEPSHQIDSAINRLRANLAVRGVSFLNASVPGDGSMTNYLRVGDATLGNEDAAVVMLGTNDRIHAANLNEFRANAEAYLKKVAARYHGRIYVISEPPSVNEVYHFSTGQADATLRSLCSAHGWEFMSLYGAFKQLSVADGVPLRALFADGLHPNRMGQDAMWEALRQMLDL